MVPIPLVDRGRAEFACAKAIITETMDCGTYKLRRKHGLLKQVYSRNQSTICAEKFVTRRGNKGSRSQSARGSYCRLDGTWPEDQ